MDINIDSLTAEIALLNRELRGGCYWGSIAREMSQLWSEWADLQDILATLLEED